MPTYEKYSPPLDLRAAPGNDEANLLGCLHDLIKEADRAKDHALTRKDGLEEEDDLRLYRGETGPKDRFFDANFTQAFIDRMVAQLTDNRPILRVENRKIGLRGMALVLEKAMIGEWHETDMQRQLFKMAHNAAVNRSAGLYIGYDPRRGNTFVEVLRGHQLFVDPTVTEAGFFDRAEYVFIERVKPCAEIKQLFPGRGALVKADARMALSKMGGASIVESPVTDLLKRGKGTDTGDVIPRCRVWEGFIQDRQQDMNGNDLFPTGRRVIFTKDVVLMDSVNPFWDGLHPVDWFDWAVDPEHCWGLSAISLLRRLQTSFNQILDGTVENMLLTNFVQVIGDFDAIDPARWKELQKIRRSLVIRKQGAGNKSINVIPPTSFGTDKIAVARQLFTFAQLLTGVTDVTLGEHPGSLQSGQAIEGLQEGASLMTRARASRLEDFMTRAGNKLLSRVLQFTPSDRVISMLGPNGDVWQYTLNRSELFLNDNKEPLTAEEKRDVFKYLRFSVLPGSSAPGTRVNRAKIAMQLHAIGAASRKYVLQSADILDPQGMLDEAEADFAKFPPVGFSRDKSQANKAMQGE